MSEPSLAARALEEERRRRHRLAAAAGALVLVAATAAGVAWGRRHARRDAVRAVAAHVALVRGGPPAGAVERSEEPTLWFLVRLGEAPLGEQLALDCEWDSPQEAVARENHYRTRTIESRDWTTWCRQAFDGGDLAGTWVVRMSLAGRELASTAFEVR